MLNHQSDSLNPLGVSILLYLILDVRMRRMNLFTMVVVEDMMVAADIIKPLVMHLPHLLLVQKILLLSSGLSLILGVVVSYGAVLSTSTSSQNAGSWIVGFDNSDNFGWCYNLPGFNWANSW